MKGLAGSSTPAEGRAKVTKDCLGLMNYFVRVGAGFKKNPECCDGQAIGFWLEQRWGGILMGNTIVLLANTWLELVNISLRLSFSP